MWTLKIQKTINLGLIVMVSFLLNSCGKNNDSNRPPVSTGGVVPSGPNNVNPPNADFVANCTGSGGLILVSGGQTLCQKDYGAYDIHRSGSSHYTFLFSFGNVRTQSGLPVLLPGNLGASRPINTGILMEADDKLSFSCSADWMIEIDNEPNLSGNQSTLMATTGGEVLPMGGSGSIYIREAGLLYVGLNAPVYIENRSFSSSWDMHCHDLIISRCKNSAGNTYPCP